MLRRRSLLALTACLIATYTATAHAAPIPAADVRAVARGANAFSTDLYAAARPRPGNLCLATFSLHTSLTALRLAAAGQTDDDLRDALHHPETPHLHPITAGLAVAFASAKDSSLTTHTSLFLNAKTDDLPSNFGDLASKTYKFLPEIADFGAKDDLASKKINAAVDKATDSQIPAFLPPAAVTPKTQLLLASAATFRGPWATPFQRAWTQPEEFVVTGDKRVRVPMMRQVLSANYAETDQYQALELPFAGERMAMLLLLPRAGVPLEDVEKTLKSDQLNDLRDTLSPQTIALRLPRFRLAESVTLSPTLQKMGFATPFAPTANFATLAKGLSLSEVVHQSYIDITERGAGLTPDDDTPDKHAAPPAGRTVEFTADHGFVFVIWERNSRTLLVLGRVVEPAGKP